VLLTESPNLVSQRTKIQDFSRTTQNAIEILQDLFGARKCLNIKKKRHLLTIFRVWLIAENPAWSKMLTLADLEFRWTDLSQYVNTNWVLHYCCMFSISTNRKMHDFQAHFSRTFHVLEFKKIKNFPGGWEPCQTDSKRPFLQCFQYTEAAFHHLWQCTILEHTDYSPAVPV